MLLPISRKRRALIRFTGVPVRAVLSPPYLRINIESARRQSSLGTEVLAFLREVSRKSRRPRGRTARNLQFRRWQEVSTVGRPSERVPRRKYFTMAGFEALRRKNCRRAPANFLKEASLWMAKATFQRHNEMKRWKERARLREHRNPWTGSGTSIVNGSPFDN